MTYEVNTTPIDELRGRLEKAAEGFCDIGWSWAWDTERMHLTIKNEDDDPVATLHVECVQ